MGTVFCFFFGLLHGLYAYGTKVCDMHELWRHRGGYGQHVWFYAVYAMFWKR